MGTEFGRKVDRPRRSAGVRKFAGLLLMGLGLVALAVAIWPALLANFIPVSAVSAQSSYASPTKQARTSVGAGLPLFQDVRPLPGDAVSREALTRDLSEAKSERARLERELQSALEREAIAARRAQAVRGQLQKQLAISTETEARNREARASMKQRTAKANEEARRARTSLRTGFEQQARKDTAAIERERSLREELERQLALEKTTRVDVEKALARREQMIGRFVKKDQELTTRLKEVGDARKAAEQTRRASELTSSHDAQVRRDLETQLAQEKKDRQVAEEARRDAEQQIGQISADQRRLRAKLDRLIAANNTLRLAVNASARSAKPKPVIKSRLTAVGAAAASITGVTVPSASQSAGQSAGKSSSSTSVLTARQKALAEARRRAAAHRAPKTPAGN